MSGAAFDRPRCAKCSGALIHTAVLAVGEPKWGVNDSKDGPFAGWERLRSPQPRGGEFLGMWWPNFCIRTARRQRGRAPTAGGLSTQSGPCLATGWVWAQMGKETDKRQILQVG